MRDYDHGDMTPTIPITRGQKTCSACKLPIVKGDLYFNVRQPDGSEQPVHQCCLTSKKREGRQP